MRWIFEAVLPGRWAPTLGLRDLPFPWPARLAFGASLLLARLLCLLWLGRGLRTGAPLLLPRLAAHASPALRHLATWWKEAALLTADLERAP